MLCETCGFDATAWSRADLQRTLAHAVLPWFRQIVEGACPAVADALAETAARIEVLRGLDPDPEHVHEAWRLLGEAGRVRQSLEPVGSTTGALRQINTSAGGVPKLPVPTALIDARGLSGDRQGNRMHHGRPWQAVCLWSAEVIDALAAAGHPIGYGSAGENLTVEGLDWRHVRPGLRLMVGAALLETTPYAIPCKKNTRWFADGDFRRIAHDVAPGSSRIYARVIAGGQVRAGDAVVVEPGIPVPRSTRQLSFPLPR